MNMNTIIEDLIARELKSICGTCVNRVDCVYRRASLKAVIQCELFELDHINHDDNFPTRGLCISCDHANDCALPGRAQGVWRCEEFS